MLLENPAYENFMRKSLKVHCVSRRPNPWEQTQCKRFCVLWTVCAQGKKLYGQDLQSLCRQQ